MIEEMESRGALGEKYLDRRAEFCDTLVSTEMTSAQRNRELASITGPEENLGSDPFFVINSDPDDNWRKTLIVNTETGIATFRSITKDPNYMPKKELRPDADWWLDNSMMDANVQQMRAFYSSLRDLLL